MNAQLPSGLQAMIQAAQALQTDSNPTAPGPNGPQPTVANRLNQAIQQKAQQQMPQQGIMGALPGVRDIGQQAGIAGQIQAQQQAQQQQQAQDPQAVAQMAAKMLQQQQPQQAAGQGVAGLPAPMKFKDGGIIGFDGTKGSKVESQEPTEAELEQQRKEDRAKLKALTSLLGTSGADYAGRGLAAAADVATMIPRGIAGALDTAVIRPARALGANVGYISPELTPGAQRSDTMTPFYDRYIRAKEDQANEPAPAPTASSAEPAATQPSAPPAPASAPAPAQVSAAPQQKPPVSVQPPKTGVASQAAGSPIAPGGITTALPKAPTMDQVVAGAQKLVPDFATEGERELRRISGEKEAAMKAMPDLNAQGIAALEEAKAARLDIKRRQEDRDFGRSARAFFQDVARKTNTYDTVQDGILARDEAHRLANLTHQEMVLKLQQAQQAQQLGQYDRAAALAKEVNALKEKQAQYTTQAAAVSEKLLGGVYAKEAEAAIHAADRASQERMKGAELAQRANELGDSKLANQINVANSKITDAYKALAKLDDDNKMLLNMSAEVRKKSGMEDKYAQYIASRNNIQTNLIDPAISLRDSLAEKYGLPATKKVEAPSSNAPAVGTVMKGYRFKGGDPSQQANWEKV